MMKGCRENETDQNPLHVWPRPVALVRQQQLPRRTCRPFPETYAKGPPDRLSSWYRIFDGIGLSTSFIFFWPTLLLVCAAITESLEAAWAVLVLGVFGTLFLWRLLLPMMIAQAAALCLFVKAMGGLGWRVYWWQPMVVATAALTATKMWIYDYRHLDTAIGFSLTGGIPAGLIFWLAAAGFVLSAKVLPPNNTI